MTISQDQLRRRWRDLWRHLGADEKHVPPVEGLIEAYVAPSRAYHNLGHIAHCLSEFDRVKEKCASPEAVELAIWFHDLVYDPKGGDNEAQSASLAETTLSAAGVARQTIDDVTRLILATRHISVPSEDDARILVDIDLSILGQLPAVFDEYERGIRREYAHVDEPAFRKGRSMIVRRFLERKTIYGTPVFQERYEASARQNLSRSLKMLTHGSGESTGAGK